MKKTILQISLIVFLFSCGDKGIEGFVGEKIIITAKKTEEKTDLDYTWILIEQPDGSLLNSSDLNPQTDKNKMSFTPDYIGNYSIDVVVSQYGDEISSQSFLFNITDTEKTLVQNENFPAEKSKNDKAKTTKHSVYVSGVLENEDNTRNQILDRVLNDVEKSKSGKAKTTKHSVYVSGVLED